MKVELSNVRQGRTMNDQFSEIGTNLQKNIPRVTIGRTDLPLRQYRDASPDVYSPNSEITIRGKTISVEDVKKWGLVIAVTAVILYGLYRLFFG